MSFIFLELSSGVACIILRLVVCQLLHLLLFSPILKAVFSPRVSFVVQELLSLIRSHLFIFALISNILGGWSEDPAVMYVGECFAYVLL